MRRITFVVLVAALVAVISSPALAKDVKVGKAGNVGDYQVTVFAVEQPTTGTSVFKPKAGNEVLAVDVQVCSRSANVDKVNALQVTVESKTHRRYDPFGDSGHNPALSVQPLVGKGSCARGWAGYEVPIGERASYVIFTDQVIGKSKSGRWKVP